MLVIGLTGGIGCGKSTVADMFSKLNIPIIDTDLIARELVEPGKPALHQIVSTFGTAILDDNKRLDRKKLAQMCFSDEKLRRKLEAILHPAIRENMQQQLNELDTDYVIVVIPLLLETGQQQLVDRVLLVDCPEEQQIARVQQRDNRTTEEISDIISAQMPAHKKRASADDIIQNDSDIINLEHQIKVLHKKYLNLSQL
jgi:dephospho-CoA kinase